jgi:predicted ferric reductase
MTTTTSTPVRSASTGLWVTVASIASGFALAAIAGSPGAVKLLPWVLGRGLGIAGYLALVGLTGTGLWLARAPERRGRLTGPTLIWAHAWLAALTAVLVTGHVVALALDTHVALGWRGSLIPGQSGYRPLAVGLGTAGLYLGLLAAAAIALAGRLRRVGWLPLHRLASVAFLLVWMHGMLAGSDTSALRPLYIGTGAALAALWASARLQAKR